MWPYALQMDAQLILARSQKAAQSIKEGMDKRFGPTWHCCVGEGWSYSITPNTKAMLHVYYNMLGVLVFKC